MSESLLSFKTKVSCREFRFLLRSECMAVEVRAELRGQNY
jgi:hypothetical protein